MVEKVMDENTFGVRLKRYAQVTSAVGGLTARFLGERYLGVNVDRPVHAADLKALLGNLKGPVMKIAQFLSTIPEALPPDYAAELLQLQTQAPPMGSSFVRRRMAGELGPHWRDHFSAFDETPAAAASLGQVHRARTLAGTELACKLQYPDMVGVIEADLRQLKWVLGVYERFSHALQTEAVQEEITLLLREELDYQHEAQSCRLYAAIFQDEPLIHVPVIEPALSTKRLLSMSWLPGVSLLQLTEESQEQRDQIGTLLFNAWYKPLYQYGVLHGDPHPGNYTYREEGGLNLLDFGCVRIFPPTFIQGVIELYRALQANDPARAVYAYEIWGFQNLNSDVIEIITQWAKLLYEPLLDDRRRPIQEVHEGGPKGWEVAARVHAQLHRVGGIRPPREFVFMDRAAVGIGSVLMRLQAQANWHQLFEVLIESFSVTKVAESQQAAIQASLGIL
jgi:predicted unusual protein kinase regulating ubiquinone biosynthesis (AarF/ABC1/UbiB family)